MKKIYRDQNYIIIEADGSIIAIPASSSLYSHTITGEDRQEAAFLIRGINRLQYTILEAEVDSGDWENDSAIVYTSATLIDFLRGNTGY